ncbi:MAG: PQQ-binding-like beta-propeller repeat protein [Chitinophagaceae bacterium]|nr:PQQ-binding-like beta-propeller repeat protein [Chitinophagaceae bacterium]
MIKKVLSVSLWAVCLISGLEGLAQQAPLWKTDVDRDVKWMKVTPFGQVLACNSKGLSCLDPETGKILWNIEALKNCPQETYTAIEGSRFFTISPDGLNDVVDVVDMFEGTVLFNSADAGIKDISDQFYLRDMEKLLLFGKIRGGKKSSLMELMVDLKTGKTLWSKEQTYRFVGNIEAVGPNEVLVVSPAFVTKINATTGEEIWKSPVNPLYANSTSMLKKLEKYVPDTKSGEKLVKLIFSPYRPEICIVAIPSTSSVGGTSMSSRSIFDKSDKGKDEEIKVANFSAFNINTGEYVWKDQLEYDHELGVCFPTEYGLLVGSGNDGHFNMFTYDGGSVLYKTKFQFSLKKSNQPDKFNSPNFKGVLTNISLLKGNQILLQGLKDRTQLLLNYEKRKKISILNIVDPQNGKLVFENSTEIKGGINYINEIDKGVLVGTDRSLGLLDPVTGNWIFETDIECNPELIMSDESSIYFFNPDDRRLYKIAMNGSSINPVSEPVKFEEKEYVANMELIKEGVLISSNQNMTLLGFDGKLIYQKYFPAPENKTIVKILEMAKLVGYAALIAAAERLGGTVTVLGKEMKDGKWVNKDYILSESNSAQPFSSQLAQNLEYLGGTKMMMEIWKKKFNATKQGRDYQVLITQEDGNRNNPVLLKKINKSTGATDAVFELGKDKEPVYDVDLIEGKLYYINFRNESLLECYKF